MADTDFTLIIGNKNLSSWSLRPWVLMKHFDIPFAEKMIRLDQPDTRATIKDVSPSGLVPCLVHGDNHIWDSLAIAEYLAELYPDQHLWPRGQKARALARCLASEMHSGFSSLRGTWPMDFVKEGKGLWGGPGVRKDITRIVTLWEDALERYGASLGGPFLFGRFSIADAMYAPVVSRFRTYGPLRVSEPVAEYLETMWTLPAMQEWGEGARKEADAGWYRS